MQEVALLEPLRAPVFQPGKFNTWIDPTEPGHLLRQLRKKLVPWKKCGPGCELCLRAQKRSGNAIAEPVFREGVDPTRTLYAMLPHQNYGSSTGYVIETLKEQGWKGNIIVELPVRCGAGNITAAQMTACRSYASYVIDYTKPERFLLCGNVASLAVLGYSVNANFNRGSWTVLEDADKRLIPTVITCDPVHAATNRFYRRAFEEECRQLIELQPIRPRGARGYIIETISDALLAEAWAEKQPEVDFDIEISGKTYDSRYEVLMCAISNDEVSYCWNRAAMNDPLLREVLRRILENPCIGKIAHVSKSDWGGLRAKYGWNAAPITSDSRIEWKINNVDASVKLEDVGFKVGNYAHKDEIEPYLKEAKKELRASGEFEDYELEGKNALAYAYGKVPEPILAKYCMEDTIISFRAAKAARAANEAIGLRTWDRLLRDTNRFFCRVEATGMPVSRDAVRMSGKRFQAEIDRLAPKFAEAGVDPDSTQSIRDFFSREGIVTPYLTETGLMATHRRALEAVKDRHWIIAAMLEHRSLAKMMSAYAVALERFIRDDGRVHPTFDPVGARSGRTSSSKPNGQNIPTRSELGRMIKACFVAMTGWEIVQLDFTTLEVFVTALVTGDKKMQAACMGDFHWATAKRLAPIAWGMTAEELEAEAAADPKMKKMRRDISKTTVFSLIYGTGPNSLADKLKMPVHVAEALIQSMNEEYADARNGLNEFQKFAKKNGYTYVPWEGDLSDPYRRRPLWPIGGRDPGARGNAERAASNTPIQGLANDYCLRSGIAIMDRIDAEGWPAEIIATVHDSILIHVRSDYAKVVAKAAHGIMTGWNSGPLPLRVDVESGPTWGSLSKMDLAA